MKFLCEHCKAKYQIADDKVAGRTVRMKCRKCGNHIEVRAAVTESSVAAKAPESENSATARAAPARPAPPPRPKPLAASVSHGGATTGRGDGALAGAFQRNVQRDDEAVAAGMDLRELSAADEWYVAVNGVPVGPVRIGEVRRKAAMGAVTEDSLCWQEGMEEWRTIRTVTELAAVVREAASGGRISHLPEPPRPPTSPPTRQRISTVPAAPQRPQARTPLAPQTSRNNIVPFARMANAQPAPSEEDGGPTVVGRSPLLDELANDPLFSPSPPHAAPAPGSPAHFGVAPQANGAHRAPDPFAPAPAPDPFMQQPVQAAPFAAAQLQEAAPAPPIVAAAPSRRGPPTWMLILMVAMGCSFAITAGIVVFTRPPTPVAVAAATTSAAPVVAPTAATPPPVVAAQPDPASAPVTVDAGGAKVASTGGGGRPGGGRPGTAATPAPGAAADPALQALINGTSSGPNAGPTPGGPSGPQLSEDDVNRVVRRYQTGVKRTCWDRITQTAASVNVTVNVTVAGSGAVSSANATGNDPVVTHCVEEEVKGWHFPGGGAAQIPFHFIRQ